MKLKRYKEQLETWPRNGHHIMAQYDERKIIVYQSYRPAIGNYAVRNQQFGGEFSLSRMTWIKPNFLWMMYRNGWGTKEGQQVVLAVHLKREAFQNYLENAIHSSFQKDLYQLKEWKQAVQNSDVRLQWDPDHDPFGAKLDRRAIQIGLRGKFIRSYANDDMLEIEDITSFVKEQYQWVKQGDLHKLVVPEEAPFIPEGKELQSHLQLSNAKLVQNG